MRGEVVGGWAGTRWACGCGRGVPGGEGGRLRACPGERAGDALCRAAASPCLPGGGTTEPPGPTDPLRAGARTRQSPTGRRGEGGATGAETPNQ